MRNGLPVYDRNPSLRFYSSEKYLNLSIDVLTRVWSLTSAGKAVLKLLLEPEKKSKLNDKTVVSDFYHYKSTGISERKFSRGVAHLLDNELTFPRLC